LEPVADRLARCSALPRGRSALATSGLDRRPAQRRGGASRNIQLHPARRGNIRRVNAGQWGKLLKGVPPDGFYFTASINAFNVSSDGQQQPSTPLFGSGTWWPSMSISTRQPVIGATLNRSASLTIIEGEEISLFVAFGRGAGRTSARAVVMLSDVFAGGVVEERLLNGWSPQQRLEPCE